MDEKNNEKMIEKSDNSSETSYLLNFDKDLKKDAHILSVQLDMSLKDLIVLAIKDFVKKKQKEIKIKEELRQDETY